MLKKILSISGKPGLFRHISQAKNMLIVESLSDGKRLPTYSNDKVISLGDIAMFTDGEDIKFSEVLKKVKEKENSGKIAIDSKADNDTLRAYMAEVLPNYDRERVYPSDIRKMISWYNLMIDAGISDFEDEKESVEGEEVANEQVKEKEPAKKAKVQKNAQVKIQDKKMQSTKGTRTKV
jgi:hypothetical protein